MTYRTWTVFGNSRKPPCCLVCWPEEDNQLSIVSAKKITSPQQDDLVPGSFCKVKGFEKNLCKVVATGTQEQMKKKLNEMESSEGMENVEPGECDAQPPPKKKPRKASMLPRPRKGKENKTPTRRTKKKEGNIILVGAKMNSEPLRVIQPSTSAPPQPPTSAPPQPSTTAPPQPSTSAPPEPSTSAPPEPSTTAPPEPSTSAPPEPSTSAPPEPSTSAPPEPSTSAPPQPSTPAPGPNSTEVQTSTPASPYLADGQTELSFSSFSSVSSSPTKAISCGGSLRDEEASLLLGITVDDHSKRLDKLEAIVARLEAAETSKMDRISKLEASVARLEALMHASLSSSLPPLPPAPPAAVPNHPPLPSPHPLAGPTTTPLPPPHPAPMVGATYATTPLPPTHPAPMVRATTTPLSRPHPATTPSRPPHPPTTPLLPPHPAPTLEANPPPLPPHPIDPAVTVRGRLPSSVINKTALSLVGDVVKSNADLLRKEGKMGTMAVVLAREAFFGEEVMRQCTAKGYGDKPGLPLTELMQLKDEVRKLYPHFVTSQAEFEEKWVKICDALSQACKRIRHRASKK